MSSRANGQGSWTDRVLPGSATRQIGGDCPPLSPVGPDVCGGLTACTEQYRGAPRGFGLARTQSGRAYAVWLDETADVSYSLAVPASCGSPCYCDRRITAASGHVDVVLARVEDAPTVPRIVRRIRLQTGGAIRANQLVVNMAARAETLHIVASVGIDSAEPTFAARYLRVNAAPLE